MRQTLIAASLIAVILIALVGLVSSTHMLTGRAIDLASDVGVIATIALGIGGIGMTMMFLWNK